MKKITHGRLVYHSYESFTERGGRLFIYDFATDKLDCISDSWTNVKDPMNASWTTDGTAIFFMGMNTNPPDPSVEEGYSWDIFYHRIGSKKNPKNLTNDPKSRNNDPKVFFGRNKKIVYQAKDENRSHIRTLTISDTNAEKITIKTLSSSTDAILGMPIATHRGKRVYFSPEVPGCEDRGIYVLSVDSGTVDKVFGCGEDGVFAYYPIIDTGESMLFFAAHTETDKADQIYCKTIGDKSKPKLMPFNIPGCDCADPCIVDDRHTIISSIRRRRRDGTRIYDLYVCDNITGEAVSLSEYNAAINTERSELGACYIRPASGLATPALTNAPVDVTESFRDCAVLIQSLADVDKGYLCVYTSQPNAPIRADRRAREPWNHFEVRITQDGWAAFKAYENKKYISVWANMPGAPLRATADAVGSWECFRILSHEGKFLLQAQANGSYVMVDINGENTPGGDIGVFACAGTARAWEQFRITVAE